ncbi:MAG: aldehyde ferredoxin oxidoreductase family protein [Methanofollis sp.]|uniref:aldehyde ferredoxin oxidoreductase family protein n=1 Tax=Methanofollis sp. TaxID=2052835 RepID=UPI002602C42B|nr:aldehyde ferredoxin oxidoreductase family protein [Methanofollis sp.]MDD4254167.1 aldehyde ferredoxin oxidoreductase family protein [Methanofollis sp.]
MHGWIGTVLRVNLTEGTVKKEALKKDAAENYIGGRGLGEKYFMDEVDPKVDALSPANKLIFATGPLTGTMGISTGRYDVVAKGPLNDTLASSNSGGYFGAEVKYAGYDLIIFEGKAAKPVYLWINNDHVEIRDATALWGKTVYETDDAIRAATDIEAEVACIGPAGEKLVKFGCIMNDKNRAAGRTGIGAVMGSKNLKGFAVRGTGGIRVADKEAYLGVVRAARKKIAENPVTSAGLPTYGSNILVNIINQTGAFPTRNWQEAYSEEADKISGETLTGSHLLHGKGCGSCVVGCGRVSKARGKYNEVGEGPEYETAWAFGADCGIFDMDAVLKANFLCNELGLDTISMGSTIACAMELYEIGAVDQKKVGYDLRFGNADAMVALTRATAYREGFGNDLAEGSFRLATKYGHPELSMTVKKQEMPAYDPRAVQGIGLEYATSNRGGCHVRGYTISPEVLGLPMKMDPSVIEGKPEILKIFQDLTGALSASGTCLFSSFAIGADEIAAELKAATGIDYTTEKVMQIGERIWNMERMFIIKNGYSEKDDTLPPRLLNDPIPAGPAKGQVSRLPEMLPKYYEIRGWDKHGVPKKEKLAELGLGHLAS